MPCDKEGIEIAEFARDLILESKSLQIQATNQHLVFAITDITDRESLRLRLTVHVYADEVGLRWHVTSHVIRTI